MSSIIFENKRVKLVMGENAVLESFVLKATGEELLSGERFPFFSVTQERPFNNEIKLIYMNKRTTYPANRVRREGDELIVGFDLAPYEAVVSVELKDDYIAFTMKDFIVHPTDYDYLKMDTPPAVEFRIATLPVKERKKFGKWLNVVWDENAAVALIGATPHTRIEAEKRGETRILTADAVKGIKLRGCTTVLVASETKELLDVIDTVECDLGMPRGVKSRRGEFINSAIYWTDAINPENVDDHIELMKKGGFRLALLYYKAFFQRDEDFAGYVTCGNYEFRPDYPNGYDSLRYVLDKIHAAGIHTGIHFLHTHIGIKSHYVTPKVDRRLNLTRKFTLSRPLGETDTVIYVDENPEGSVMYPECRRLAFMGEAISYESYTTEPPYCFIGCERGVYNTDIISHVAGEIGGILDVSEFSATSIYLNQNTDIQDEIADKIARIYDLGFEFVYYDGSEGVGAPFEFHVPNAQYRVYKKLGTAPLFCEGAAKSHFSWHMLSGANAFDIFPTPIFKEMIDKFPVVAAKEMQNDFTRVNFGWWEMYADTRPDVYEYGMMRATAWNCPATVRMRPLRRRAAAPLRDCSLDVIKRWEDAKASGFFTEEMKADLREHKGDVVLFINEKGGFELHKASEVKCAEGVYAFIFERAGKACASVCYVGEERALSLPIEASKVKYFDDRSGEAYAVASSDNGAVIKVGTRRFLECDCTVDELRAALAKATLADA